MTTSGTSAQTSTAPALGLAEIRQLVTAHLPALPEAAPPEALTGKLADTWAWLARAQHKTPPHIRHPRIALFLAAHGAFPEAQKDVSAAASPRLSALAADSNADVRVYEMDLAAPSADFRQGKALDDQGLLQALAYGMMAVQPGVDILLVALPNPVAAQAAAAMTARLAQGADALDVLRDAGGYDIAAATGAAIAARLAKIPVLADGAASVAADILRALSPDAAAHIRKTEDILPDAAQGRLQAGEAGALTLGLLRSLCAAA